MLPFSSGKSLNWSGSDALNVAAKTQAPPIASDGVRVGVLFPRTVLSLASGAPLFGTRNQTQTLASGAVLSALPPCAASTMVCGDAWQQASLLIFVARELRKHVAILEREIAELEQA
jgi:hypothetical protein